MKYLLTHFYNEAKSVLTENCSTEVKFYGSKTTPPFPSCVLNMRFRRYFIPCYTFIIPQGRRKFFYGESGGGGES